MDGFSSIVELFVCKLELQRYGSFLQWGCKNWF